MARLLPTLGQTGRKGRDYARKILRLIRFERNGAEEVLRILNRSLLLR
jgi:hypothetical protein